MTETKRIRWQETRPGISLGYVGTLEPWAFQVWQSREDYGDVVLGEWVLSIQLPGALRERLPHGNDPGALKAKAEDWLAGFVSSLGAVFPADATLPQRDSRGMLDLTCDACGATTGTNCHDDDIRCAECGAHRCPHCGGWFGRDD